jgi:hypothetical protein
MRRTRAWLLVAVAVSGTACRPRATAPSEVAPVAGPPATAPLQRPAQVPAAVAVATSPVQLLPDTTPLVATAAGVRAWLGVVDLDGLVARYRSQYEQMAALVTASAGFNLLDPGQWASVGVDAGGPMGAALLDLRSESFAGFVTVADREKFRAFLDRASAGRLSPVLEDRGLVLKTEVDAGTAVVLRDGFAFFVVVGREQRAPYDFARALATLDPARGLAASPRYQRALAGGEPGRPLQMYLDLWAMIEAERLAEADRVDEQLTGWAEQELERAAARGAPAEEVARLRQQADEDRAWQARDRERRTRRSDLMRAWFAAVEPLVFEFSADPSGVVGAIRARMPETAPLRAAVVNAATPSPVLLALGERPVFAIGGRVDVIAALAGFEAFARAEGDDPAKLYAELRAATAVDVPRELAPILTGAGGLAVTVAPGLLRGEGDPARSIGFAAGLGVSSPERAQALLQAAVQKIPVKARREPKTGAYALDMPGYRTVYAGVVAGQIVVTTDLGVVQRVAGAAQGSLGKLLPPALVPVLTARDTAGQVLVDLTFPMYLLGARRSSTLSRGLEEPYAMFPDAPRAKVDAAPRSAAYKAKRRAWEALDAKIRREEQAEERRQSQRLVALAEAMGATAGNLREQPDGLVLSGGHFFGPGGLNRAIDVMADSGGGGSEKLWELYGERSAAEQELQRLRVLDVAKALGVPAPL